MSYNILKPMVVVSLLAAMGLTGCSSSEKTVSNHAPQSDDAWKITMNSHWEATPGASEEEIENADSLNARQDSASSAVLVSDSLYKMNIWGNSPYQKIRNRKDSVVIIGYGKAQKAYRYDYDQWLRETREDTSRFATFQLFPDSTKMIQGKQAHKVVYSLASGDSLTYTAWYSSDFPSWIWEGAEAQYIPGIVLEVSFEQNHLTYHGKASSIETIPVRASDFTVPDDYQLINVGQSGNQLDHTEEKSAHKDKAYNQAQDSVMTVLDDIDSSSAFRAGSIYKHGFARVKNRDTTFYVDKTGQRAFDKIVDSYHPIEVVTPSQPGFVNIERDDAIKMLIVVRDGKTGLINSQSGWVLPAEYDDISVKFKRYLSLKKDGEMGYADTWGSIQVPPIFREVNIMDERYYDVRVDDKWGIYSSKEDSLVIPAEYDAFDFCGGCSGTVDYAYAKKDGKWGILAFDGAVLVPFNFEKPGHVSMRGDRWVTNFKKDGEHVVINMKTDKVFGPPEYADMKLISGVLAVKKEGKYGLINAEGEQIRPFEYDAVADPYDNFHYGPYILVYNNDKAGIVSNRGEVIIPADTYDGAYASGKGYFGAYRGDKVALIDTTGAEIFPADYEIPNWRRPMETPKPDGDTARIFKVRRDTLYGFYNASGDVLVEPQFSFVSLRFPPDSSRSYVEIENEEGRTGLYSLRGREIVPPWYDDYKFINDNFVRTRSDWSFGLYSLHQVKEIVPPEYELVEPISERYIYIKKVDSTDTTTKLWDHKKDEFVNLPFDHIEPAGHQLLIVSDTTEAYLYSLEDQEVISKPYPVSESGSYYDGGVQPFEHGLALVKKDDKFGYINPEGQEVIPPHYDGVSINPQGMIKLSKRVKDDLREYAFADSTGEQLTPFKYTQSTRYDNDVAWRDSPYIKVSQYDDQQRLNFYGLIDSTGREIVPAEYDEVIPSVNDNGFLVKQGQGWGVLDENGEVLMPPVLDNVFTLNTTISRTAKDIRFPVLCELEGRYFYMDEEGNLPPFKAEGKISFDLNQGWGILEK